MMDFAKMREKDMNDLQSLNNMLEKKVAGLQSDIQDLQSLLAFKNRELDRIKHIKMEEFISRLVKEMKQLRNG